jgi:hypothetical protein
VRKGLQTGAKDREIILTELNYNAGEPTEPVIPGYQKPIERFQHQLEQQSFERQTYMGRSSMLAGDDKRTNIMTPMREAANSSAMRLH